MQLGYAFNQYDKGQTKSILSFLYLISAAFFPCEAILYVEMSFWGSIC